MLLKAGLVEGNTEAVCQPRARWLIIDDLPSCRELIQPSFGDASSTFRRRLRWSNDEYRETHNATRRSGMSRAFALDTWPRQFRDLIRLSNKTLPTRSCCGWHPVLVRLSHPGTPVDGPGGSSATPVVADRVGERLSFRCPMRHPGGLAAQCP